MYDVIIIGGGVSGCAIARELSRYEVNVCLLEKGDDVCSGTSKANSAIVHAGFDCQPGTLMAKLNVEGNLMMPQLCADLDIPFAMIGSLVVCTDPTTRPHLEELKARGEANGVKDLEIIERDELLKMEPNISDQAVAALWAPTGGIVCPFELTIGMAENACENGVDFVFNAEVTGIEKQDDVFQITTTNGSFACRYLINAAGVHADTIHNMLSAEKMTIIPRKGEYYLLDHHTRDFAKHTIFALPTKMGKGILVSPTVHGNILVGPTATDIDDKEAVNTTSKGLNEAATGSFVTMKNVPLHETITSFAGLRAHEEHHEFIIGEVKDVPGMIDCAAIESPGLTSSPAIGKMVAKIIVEKEELTLKENFKSVRKGVTKPFELSSDELNQLIREKPAFGQIICRCESITEGEILEAIHRPLGARSLDAVKRRTRAGMGRCQSGFCSPKVMAILAREIPELSMEDVSKCGAGSTFITGLNKM